jgi:hypothetical protein
MVQGKIRCGAKFSAHIQISPGALPSSYKMGTALFPGVKQPWHLLPTPYSIKVKERIELYLYSNSVPSWQVIR